MSIHSASPRPALTVSVALCTHNGERYIEDQLRSILEQSLPPREIVLSDDDSTDSTVERALATVSAWASEHPDRAVAVRVLENRPALRVAKNFERAILACEGDLVALCDQDDVWQQDRLASIVEIFSTRPDVLVVHSDARLVDADGQPLGSMLLDTLRVSRWERDSINAGRAFRVLIRRNVVTGATAVIRRGVAHQAMPVPEGWIHDEWLAAFAAARGSLFLDGRALIDYRQHDNNQIGAASLDAKGKLGRLLEPRAARNQRLLVRAASLNERFSAAPTGVSEEAVRLAAGKFDHEQFRSSLPAGKLARIAPILRVAASGGYRQFGLGAQDVLRDLVQPAR